MTMQPFDPIATGQRVRRQREALGWSQEALGTAAGLTERTVQRIESGADCGMQLHTFARLYQTLGVTPNALLGVQDMEDDKSVVPSLA